MLRRCLLRVCMIARRCESYPKHFLNRFFLERSKRATLSFRKRFGAGKKLVKSRKGNKQVKHEEKRPEVTCNDDRGIVPITPQMIRRAVKELHTRRVFVSSSLIADHLQRCYPVENNPTALRQELEDKLDVAVSVGLIVKSGPDSYCLPNLRQQATSLKTDLTAFWERYNRRGSRIRRNNVQSTRKKLKKPSQRGLNCYDDEESDIQ